LDFFSFVLSSFPSASWWIPSGSLPDRPATSLLIIELFLAILKLTLFLFFFLLSFSLFSFSFLSCRILLSGCIYRCHFSHSFVFSVCQVGFFALALRASSQHQPFLANSGHLVSDCICQSLAVSKTFVWVRTCLLHSLRGIA